VLVLEFRQLPRNLLSVFTHDAMQLLVGHIMHLLRCQTQLFHAIFQCVRQLGHLLDILLHPFQGLREMRHELNFLVQIVELISVGTHQFLVLPVQGIMLVFMGLLQLL